MTLQPGSHDRVQSLTSAAGGARGRPPARQNRVRDRSVPGIGGGAATTPHRPHHIGPFGAPGFTGALTADYLAGHADPGTRWALAGRNQAKLAAVRDRAAAIDPACADLPLLHADTTDPSSI